MLPKKYSIFSVLFFASVINLWASSGSTVNLTLKEVLYCITRENPKVLLNRESVDQALYNAYVKRADLLPTVTASASQSRSKLFVPFGTQTFSGYVNTFDAKFAGTAPILDLRKLADYSIARMGHKISELDYRALIDDVQAEASRAYFEHLRNTKRLNVLDENIKRAQFLLEMADARYKAGVASAIDVTRAEVELARQRKARLQQNTIITQSELNIKKLLDIPMNCCLSVDGDSSCALAQPTEHPCCLDQAFDNRSDYKSALEALRKNQFEHKAVIWEYLPKLEASGDYGVGSFNAFDSKAKEKWNASLKVSMPIFEGFRINSKRLQAKSVVRAQRYVIKELQNEIHASIILNQQDLESRYEQITISEGQVQLGRKELDLAQERFKAGVADNQEVVDAQAKLAEFEFELVEAVYAYNLAQVEWARTHGDLSMLLCYNF